ncbi:MAG: apolipoprotein N-acyltransferase [Alphaproteobacteria bacterium]|nr:apolipoprotein N-acyltransferase [Alphaproteobacteria bacterium]
MRKIKSNTTSDSRKLGKYQLHYSSFAPRLPKSLLLWSDFICTVLKIRKIHPVLLSLLSGVILSLAWPERGFPGLLFIGFLPLLLAEENLYQNREKTIKFSALIYSYPGFLLWNLLTTWWIVNSTFVGAALAIILNSLFMSIVFQAFHWTRKKLSGSPVGYLALISYWIALEYLHLNWDLNWPWLNLGNGFATWYKWVQWYEYTGTFGGTLWVLSGNLVIFRAFKEFETQNAKRKMQNAKLQWPPSLFRWPGLAFLWILLPILYSLVIYARFREESHPVNFVVVQPNIDPYSEQYVLPPPEVIGKIMSLADPKLDSATNFLIAPESAIQESMWENDLSSFESIGLLRKALVRWPDLNILIGGSTFYQLPPGAPLPRWARKFTDSPNHYVAYNAAILINNRDSLQLYHKSKLTPGVEILPSFKGFNWLEKYAIDLGGTVGSLGMDSVRKVYSTVKTVGAAPAICYESIFGEFFAEFVRNGARLMIIITNDGWWGNTPGHRQHFSFTHLRAIETRRSIARSANTGISALIDQRGDAHQVTGYWKPAVIKGTLNANDRMTFYVRHGDYIARIFTWTGGILLLSAIGWSLRKRFSLKSKPN